jgi:RNA polymerase sigma-70 factor, ECF subfamily
MRKDSILQENAERALCSTGIKRVHTTPISLLDRLRQPNPAAAWERFVELYTPVLFAWARRLGLQASDAADLVQEVFTLLVEKLPEFEYDKHKSFRSWLRTVTLNKWRDVCRRKAVIPVQAVGGLSDASVPDPADALDEAEYRRQLVSRALELLRTEFQPVTWQACWEYVVQGRPAAEVARELGISPNAVYLAKGRVLRRLRAELEGLLD